MPKQQNPTLKKAMLQALEASLGVVTVAAKNASIDRSTHYEWLKTDPEYKQQVDDLSNVAIDFAESSLFKQMKEGNAASIIFYLKTKAKHRGYIERKELTGADGTKLIDWSD